MIKYDVIIIGSGPAGIITGTTVRKQYPDKTVLMIAEEAKGLVPCGIPYIFHKLNSVEKNKMGPKTFVDAGGDVIVDKATKVNAETKTITTKSKVVYSYDKLVFATGSIPTIASFIPGYDLENVFYIKKSYEYIENLFNTLKDKKHIVIVGGGFIGAEVAEQLAANQGKTITLIESEKFCFSKAFSPELSEIATNQLDATHTIVRTESLLAEVVGENGKVSKVKLKSGEEIKADAIIFSIGYKPNVELAEKAGLPLNQMGAIIVDNYSRTHEKDICAVGDCSQTIGFLTGRYDYIMLASTAAAEARILGYNLFGVKMNRSFTGTLGVFSTQINEFTMAAAGVNEKNAKEANVDFLTAKFTDMDKHPATLDNTKSLTVKLYFSPTNGTILGGETWGSQSAGEVINIIAFAIQKSVTIYELVSFQVGTHPLLTTAPTKPVLIKAAENAIQVLQKC